jgi:hypothetical protein
MAEPVTLSEQTAQQIERLGSLDFVVGVATKGHAPPSSEVVERAWTALQRVFPGARTAVIQADPGSRDGTAERARDVPPGDNLLQISVAPENAPVLGSQSAVPASSLHAILTIANRLSVRGCAVLGLDPGGLTAERVAHLLAPVAGERADFVVPYYARHRFEGALTTSVVYPFIRALYGKRIRYPAAAEFACSAKTLQQILAADIWRADPSRVGIEFWLTPLAVVGGARVTQAFLGTMSQMASDTSADLGATLTRTLGTLFQQAERTAQLWQKVRGSQPVPIEGGDTIEIGEAAPADAQRAIDAFRLGEQNLTEIWTPVLPPLTRLELRKLARLPDAQFRLPDALWARIVYDFAIAYRTRVMNRDHLLAAFAPLYSGWLASYISEIQLADETAAEERVERLCLQYEAEKPYLISRWRWPDRFSP